MGCWGSGKTYLSRGIEKRLSTPLLSLDQILFRREGGGQGRGKLVLRDRAETRALLSNFIEERAWVVEGVYGKLIEQTFCREPMLLWIHRSEEECLQGLEVRGEQMKAQYNRDLSPQQRDKMVARIQSYRSREDHLGYAFHRELYDGYRGEKWHLKSAEEMQSFLQGVGE